MPPVAVFSSSRCHASAPSPCSRSSLAIGSRGSRGGRSTPPPRPSRSRAVSRCARRDRGIAGHRRRPAPRRHPGGTDRTAGGGDALPVGRLVEARLRLLRPRDVGLREARASPCRTRRPARPTWVGACRGGGCCRATSSSSAATATSACTSAVVAWCTRRKAASGCGSSASRQHGRRFEARRLHS